MMMRLERRGVKQLMGLIPHSLVGRAVVRCKQAALEFGEEEQRTWRPVLGRMSCSRGWRAGFVKVYVLPVTIGLRLAEDIYQKLYFLLAAQRNQDDRGCTVDNEIRDNDPRYMCGTHIGTDFVYTDNTVGGGCNGEEHADRSPHKLDDTCMKERQFSILYD